MIPLLDTLRVFAIRIFNRRSPFSPDRNHIHHLLLDRGFSHRTITLLLVAFNVIMVVFVYMARTLGCTILILSVIALFFISLPLLIIPGHVIPYHGQVTELIKMRRLKNLNWLPLSAKVCWNKRINKLYRSEKSRISITSMSDELDFIVEVAKDSMVKAINHLKNEPTRIRAGKANPQMLESVNVDYYGVPTVINQMANVSVMDARTLTIQPWEKNMLQPIERAIINANLGVTPQNDGNIIRIFMPPLTEERRKEFVKRSYSEGEQTRIAIRNIRRESIEQIKKLQKDGLSEDLTKDAEKEMQSRPAPSSIALTTTPSAPVTSRVVIHAVCRTRQRRR